MLTVDDIFEMIEKLELLKKEAIVERSHNYTGATVTETIIMLYQLASEKASGVPSLVSPKGSKQ